ncbi:MAG: hypothetical protein D3909_01740 [Candidatus Electrothrix sp. ATG1]|nr:hypothetical protein [Candidatus Electrothrix sp. ATG1]
MALLKNLLHGAGTVLNIHPHTRKRVRRFRSSPSSDTEAIKKDFEKIGNDLWKVIDEYKETGQQPA